VSLIVQLGGGRAATRVPIRAELCAVQTSGMQGLTVTTTQHGVLPWWDAALAWLTPEDRRAVYAAKRTAADTHCLMQLPSGPPLYDEPGQAYSPDKFGPLDWTHSNTAIDPQLPALVREVLDAGLLPVLFLGGDDGERGYPIAVQQLPLVVDALGDLMASTLIVPGWDGVFYGWTPEHIVTFGAQFRALCPDGYLGIEMSEGHIPLGEGPSDWTKTGRMKDYDVLLVEFSPDNLHQDSTWQIAGRLLGPRYVRPADQPAGDDPHPPWYLGDGSPRGPYYPIGFEYDTYYFVRGLSAEAVREHRAYLAAMGWHPLG
jgi:hypothetical protein